MVRLAIAGAAGRMGKTFIQAALNDPHVTLTGGVVPSTSDAKGSDLGLLAGHSSLQISSTTDLSEIINDFDVLVDFSTPLATMTHLKICERHEKKMVIGATGFNPAQKEMIQFAGNNIALVFAPNMSIGINLIYQLLQKACAVLGDTADIEIVEAHHRHKLDAPSGAALKMGEVICQSLSRKMDEVSQYGRCGQHEIRDAKTVGYSSIRGGDIVGDHTVIFACEGERVEISHRATNRTTFAKGAIRAARWLVQKNKGYFTMEDVLIT